MRDAGDRWRAAYGLPADAPLEAELERLWDAGTAAVRVSPLPGPRRAGTKNTEPRSRRPARRSPPTCSAIWENGRWSSVHDLVAPRRLAVAPTTRPANSSATGWTRLEMVRHGERFFRLAGLRSAARQLLGTIPLRQGRPTARFVCGPRASNLDGENDVRLKMCLERHRRRLRGGSPRAGAHLLLSGRTAPCDPLFRTGANDAFPEGGRRRGRAFRSRPPTWSSSSLLDRDAARLLRRSVPAAQGARRARLSPVRAAGRSVALAGLRRRSGAGELQPGVVAICGETYQGVRAPVPRSEADFDPGATWHVPANALACSGLRGRASLRVPVPPGALRGGWRRRSAPPLLDLREPRGGRAVAGHDGDGSRPARGPMRSRPSPVPDSMDASALLEYFAPLAAWLDEQNAGRACGW